jgi:hypothetical protein
MFAYIRLGRKGPRFAGKLTQRYPERI